MKTITFAFLLLGFTAFSQINPSGFDQTSTWKFNYGTCEQCTPEEYHYLYLDGDTTVDNTNYSIVRYYVYGNKYSSSYLSSQSYYDYQQCVQQGGCEPINEEEKIIRAPELFALLRVSNDSVFVKYSESISPASINEIYWYSNNLQVGDTLKNIAMESGGKVDSVAMINVGGDTRQVTYLANNTVVVEGVGILGLDNQSQIRYTGLFSSNNQNVSNIYIGELECYGYDDVDYESIDIRNQNFMLSDQCVPSFDVILSTEDVETQSDFFIQNGNQFLIAQRMDEISLFDLNGRLISSRKVSMGVTISFNIQTGFYLIKAANQQGIYTQKVYIK